MDIRLAPAEHYDNAAAALQAARGSGGPATMIRTHDYLDALTECLLGLLRVEMARLEAQR
jgi:hypothetical protein